MSSSNSLLQNTLQFLGAQTCPLTIIALNPTTGKPISVNSTFEQIFGPLYKFQEWEFCNAACDDEEESTTNPAATATAGDDAGSVELNNRTKFRNAIHQVSNSLLKHTNDDDGCCGESSSNHTSTSTTTIRNIEMLTLGTNEAGLPIRKYFDWAIGCVKEEEGGVDAIILYGSLVNEVEESNRWDLLYRICVDCIACVIRYDVVYIILTWISSSFTFIINLYHLHRARDAELIDFFQNAPIGESLRFTLVLFVT